MTASINVFRFKSPIISEDLFDNNLLQYTSHDTHLTHGHRKLRLAEDFETLHLTPNFKKLCLKHFKIRKFRLAEDFEMLPLIPDFEMLCLTCDFKTLRLAPVRHQQDATFQNIASDARLTPDRHFQIRRQVQDFDFKIMCQALFSVTMHQMCSTSLAM